MREVKRFRIPCGRVQSLVWQGDVLFDPAGGWTRFELDGTWKEGTIGYTYPFDRAIISPTRAFSVLYTALGTKALLLKGEQVHRELNRSYYCAASYEYPITFLQLPDGTEALVHCPNEYCRLEIERADTGERLTARTSESRDFFYSRLQVSPDNRYLLSAGWFWHPWDDLLVYDVEQALADPETLDGWGIPPRSAVAGEVQSAAFLDDERIILVTGEEEPLNDDWEQEGAIGPRELAVWSIPRREWLSRVPVEGLVGTLMPVGDFLVGFYDHPKLIEIATGKVVEHWDDIASGRQESSIIDHIAPVPSIGMDASHRRFAVAGENAITIVQLGD